MSIATRRVPPGWVHPRADGAQYIPLRDGTKFTRKARQWDEEAAKWQMGLRRDPDCSEWEPIEAKYRGMTYAEFNGECPDPTEYTPQWSSSECTHWQMYEELTEGTPISPVCASAEDLARWMADHDDQAMSSAHWLSLILQRPLIPVQ